MTYQILKILFAIPNPPTLQELLHQTPKNENINNQYRLRLLPNLRQDLYEWIFT